MTPQQPLYHATWEQIIKLRDAPSQQEADALAEGIGNQLCTCSRPAPSSEEVNPWCYPGCILINRAKKEAAAQAREKVLDELKMRCNKEWESTDKERRKATRTFVTTGVKTDITPHKWICASMNMVVGWIESLRTGGERR